MDIRQLTPSHAVSPQIMPEDLAKLAEAGFTTVICNRPDAEVPPTLSADTMQAEAARHGITFVYLPMGRTPLTTDLIAQCGEAMDMSQGPSLAYCASGTRSCILWAFSQAGKTPTADLIATASDCGYDIGHFAPQITALAQSGA
jgi:uncharacterized protein (TIGR01244 family)